MPTNHNLYDRDFYARSREQSELLRSGRVAEADLVNIAEEIESTGKTEKRELMSRLTVLLLHLARWRSWRLSIEGQRLDIAEWLDENPSLRPTLTEILGAAWRRAMPEAQRETGLEASALPSVCPWSATEIMDSEFWPR